MRLVGLLALSAALCAPLAAFAAAAPHYGNSATQGGCTSCHIGHQAPGRTLTKTSVESALCDSCHSAGGFGFPWSPTEQATTAGAGVSHSWSTSVVNATHEAVNPGAAFPLGTGSVLQCSTCHDTHGTAVLKSGTMHTSVAVGGTVDCEAGYTCGTLTLSTVPAGSAAAAYVIWTSAAGQFKISHDNGQTWLGHNGTVWGNYPNGKTFTANSLQTLDDGLVQVRLASTTANQRWVSFYVGYPFLRVDNTNGALCNSCHTVRNRTVADVEGTNPGYPANGTNTFSHPVGAALTRPYDRTVGTNGPVRDADGTTSDTNPTNDLKFGTGGVVTCNSCHRPHQVDSNSITEDVWSLQGAAMTCTSCHGLDGRATFDPASPPVDTCGNTAISGGTGVNRVGTHETHLVGKASISGAVACAECHPNGAAGAPGHPAANCSTSRAPVSWGTIGTGGSRWDGVKSPSWDEAGQTCSATYCHGNFRPLNKTTAVPWAGTVACGGCHAIAPANGPHGPVQTTSCVPCHAGYTPTAANLSVHVNGTMDVSMTCTSCHGTDGRSTFDPASPPKDTCGNTAVTGGTGVNRVGTHQTHLVGKANISGPTACNECHINGAAGAAGHPNSSTNCGATRSPLAWGTIAKGGNGWDGVKTPTWNATSQGCTNYCHGDFRPLNNKTAVGWGATVNCGGCHAIPPANAVHSGQTTCNGCHAGYTPTAANLTIHVNGVGDWTTSCTSCHGDPARTTPPAFVAATPPKDTCGNTAVTGGTGVNRVGTHATHMSGKANISGAVACNECHVNGAAGAAGHPNSSTNCSTTRSPLAWGTIAKGGNGWDGVKTPTWNATTQGCTNYCHGDFRPLNNRTAVGWGATVNCGGCHAIPPANAIHSGKTTCTGCHPNGYTMTAANLTTHVNGQLEASSGGPDCYGCHSTAQGSLRAVAGDFAATKKSHHVRGTMSSAGTGANVGNNYDCVVCHLEGQIVTAPPSTDCTSAGTCTNPTYHANKKIDLRDVDAAAPGEDAATTNLFTYDKAAVAASVAAGGGNSTNWNSSNATWRTETSGWNGTAYIAGKGLDRFCLNCHDSAGAAQISTFRLSTETSRTATDPFWDGTTTMTNGYDGLNRARVIDIKSKVSCGTPTTCASSPPPQGIYSRHAIRGQSTSVYVKYTGAITCTGGGTPCLTIYDAGNNASAYGTPNMAFTNMGTSENGPLWNDTSVMGCADCHTTDGANGTQGNAHGADGEYLNKDRYGTGALGLADGTTEGCFRCHTYATYQRTGTPHLGSGASNSDYDTSTGASRATLGANDTRFGSSCHNCHGGAQGDGTAAGDTDGFGWIHGSSQQFKTGTNGGTTGTRKAYRFMNGGALRYWVPGNATTWNTTGFSCYTLQSGGDTWSACSQHPSTAKTSTKKFARPLPGVGGY